jgi:transposase-like protein
VSDGSSGRAGEGRPHSVEFKRAVVKIGTMLRVQVQTVANAMDVQPFMLSRYRNEVRDGVLPGAREADPGRVQAGAGAQAAGGRSE